MPREFEPGGLFLVYHSADGEQVATLDFRESEPMGVLPETYGPGKHQNRPVNPFVGGAGHLTGTGIPRQRYRPHRTQ